MCLCSGGVYTSDTPAFLKLRACSAKGVSQFHQPNASLRTRRKGVIPAKQGFADKGGVSASEAQPLHFKSGCKVPFEAIWQLVSPNAGSAILDCSSFCLFMHLLKASIKGIQLPASISPEQVGLTPSL